MKAEPVGCRRDSNTFPGRQPRPHLQGNVCQIRSWVPSSIVSETMAKLTDRLFRRKKMLCQCCLLYQALNEFLKDTETKTKQQRMLKLKGLD